MNLWIRSQDREILTKANSLWVMDNQIWMEVPFYENTKKIGLTVTGHNRKLATYKTKERALEVLDEIDEFIDLFNRKGFGNVLSDDGVHPKHTIYRMPLE